MRRLVAVVFIFGVFASAGSPASAGTPKAARYLDQAASCRRAGKSECVLKQAGKALEWLKTPAGQKLPNLGRLTREALILNAESLALLGREGTAAAFDQLIAEVPDYRPQSPEAPVAEAFDAARLRRIKAALPATITAGEPSPPPRPEVEELLFDPVIYAPKRLLELDPATATRKSFRLALGVGGAIIAGDSADVFEHGLAATLELAFKPDDSWRAQLTVSVSLHDVVDGLRAEPGFGRGLTTVAITMGAGYDLQLIEDFEMIFALAVGGGFFGARSATDEAGLVGQAVVGLRYWISDALALRADATPVVFVPIDGDVGLAAHVNVFARAEAKF